MKANRGRRKEQSDYHYSERCRAGGNTAEEGIQALFKKSKERRWETLVRREYCTPTWPPPRESLTFSLPSIKTTLCRGVHPCVRSYICTVVSLLSCLLLASFVVFILPSLCSPCVTAESGETSNYTAQRVLSPSRVQRWRRPTQQPGGTDTDTQNICTVHFAQLPQVEEEEEEKTSQQSKYRDVDLCCHWPLCVFHSAGTIYQGFANCFLCLIICSGSAGSLTSRWRPISCAHVSLSLKTTLCASLSSCQSTTAQFIIT